MTTKIKSGLIADNAIVSAHISSGAISSAHLSSIDTDNVSEGSSNLYFTTARARTSLSVTDSGGDGSLAYDNSTGAITYTGPSAAEVRAHISVTDSGGDGSLAYSNGVITYVGPSASEVRAHLSAGTGVTYSGGAISIGQSVATTASPTFADINVTGNINVTGDLNTVSVTDLDVQDKTITLGAGQNEAASGGSGIVVDGSSASLLWDEANDEFDFNKSINVTGNIGVSGTVDGVDIAARDAVLTSTTTTAGAALPKAGGTMTGNLVVQSDGGNEQFVIKRQSTQNEQLILGFHSSDYATIQSIEQGVAYRSLALNPSGGNVGIGTTAPANPLSISVQTHGLYSQHRPSSGVGVGQEMYYKFNTADGTPEIFSSIYTEIESNTNGAESGKIALRAAGAGSLATGLILIGSTGNVGIGTSSPGAKLEISGKDDAGAGDLLRLQFDNSPADTGITFTDINASVKNRISMDSGNTNDLRISAGTQIHLYGGTTNGTTSPHLTVSNDGKVGIGTSSPSQQLTVFNSTAPKISLDYAGGSNNGGSIDFNLINGGVPDALTTQIKVIDDGAYRQHLTFLTKTSGAASSGMTERMRIKPNGNVGIGTINPASTLTVNGAIESLKDNFNSSNEGGQITLRAASGSTTAKRFSFDNFNVSNASVFRLIQEDDSDGGNGVVRMALDTKGTHYFTNATTSYAHDTYAHAAVFSRNSTPNGTVVIEDSDVSSGIGNTVLRCFLRDQDPATSATFIAFADGGGRVGSVTHNDDGGGVSFNTTSDYRLKENVNYTWDATTLLKQLKPAKFNFKRNPAKTVQGMLAHEVMDIVPSSVRGDKDHMMEIGTITDSDGDVVSEGVYEHFCKEGQTWTQTGIEPLYQQLDYSRLVPLLTKAIQEQQTLIESLTARIETLEG